jgi:dihydroorotase
VRLETLLERMSAGPAAIFGLDRPRIERGACANLVLVDPARTWRVRAENFRSRSANSWLLGRRLRSKVVLTMAAGRVAFEA